MTIQRIYAVLLVYVVTRTRLMAGLELLDVCTTKGRSVCDLSIGDRIPFREHDDHMVPSAEKGFWGSRSLMKVPVAAEHSMLPLLGILCMISIVCGSTCGCLDSVRRPLDGTIVYHEALSIFVTTGTLVLWKIWDDYSSLLRSTNVGCCHCRDGGMNDSSEP